MLSLRSFSIGGAIIVLGVLFYGGFVSGLSVFQIVQGGTGTSTAPTYGKLFVGNAAGTWDYVSTSSLGIIGTADGAFSTTSANHWSSVGLGFSTTSSNYWSAFGLGFSTTSTDYWKSVTTFTGASTTLLSDQNTWSTTGTSTFSGNVQVTGNLRVDGAFYAPVTIVSSGNTTINGALNVTGQTTLATSLTGLLKASSGVVSAATAGTDYENPLTFTYPLQRTTNTISLAFGTTTANTWSSAQTFSTSPVFSTVANTILAANSTGTLIGTSTPTASRFFATSTLGASVFPYASSTALSISGTGYIGTLTLTTDLSVANGGTGLSTFGGTEHVLFTSTADNLTSDSTFTFTAARDRLTLSYASTTAVGVTGTLYLPNSYFNSTRIGLGSTTPSALWGISISTSTMLMGGQFSVTIASSTTNTAHRIINWDSGNTQRIILAQNTTIDINSTSSYPRDGAKYILDFCQDATGSRTLTWSGSKTPIWQIWGGTSTILATANTMSSFAMTYDGRTQTYTMRAFATSSDPRACVP